MEKFTIKMALDSGQYSVVLITVSRPTSEVAHINLNLHILQLEHKIDTSQSIVQRKCLSVPALPGIKLVDNSEFTFSVQMGCHRVGMFP